jgi:TonB family protein
MVVDAVDLRWIAQLTLLTALLSFAGTRGFHADAPSRRAFGLLTIIALATMPWVLLVSPAWSWPMIVDDPQRWNRLWNWRLPATFLFLWACVALVIVLRMAAQALRAEHALRNAQPCTDARIDLIARGVARRAGLARPPALRQCDGLGPCCSPLGLALVALPRNSTGWDNDTLTAVLAHEFVHVRRRDGAQMLVFRLLLAGYWVLPWLTPLYRAYARAVEETCDDAAARICGSDVAYADAIAAIARQLASAETSMSASGMLEVGGHMLPGRIQRFVDARVLESNIPALYWAFIGIFAVALVGSNVDFILQPERVPGQVANSVPLKADGLLNEDSAGRAYPVIDVRLEPQLTRELGGTRLSLPRPVYPGQALLDRRHGQVVAQFEVSVRGHILRPAIVSGASDRSFDEAVLRAFAHAAAARSRTAAGLPPGRYRARYQFHIVEGRDVATSTTD